MRLVAVEFDRSAAGAPAPGAELVVAALLGAAAPGDGLEHVRLHSSRAGAVAVLFLARRADVPVLADCRELCVRALRAEPLLRGWTLASCAELTPPLGAVHSSISPSLMTGRENAV